MKYLQTRVLINRRKKSPDWTRGGQSIEELSGGIHSKKRSSQGRGQIHNLGEVRLEEQKSTNRRNKKTELEVTGGALLRASVWRVVSEPWQGPGATQGPL